MMDRQTLRAYDAAAEAFATDWHEQPAATDLHGLVGRFFRPGLTADIGCGSGREVAWLCANGHAAVGYDPSLDDEVVSASSGKRIQRVVARKDAGAA